eukprot:sb/3466483/
MHDIPRYEGILTHPFHPIAMTVFAKNTTTEYIPVYVDYLFGTSQFLIFLCSCFLNPIVFSYHFTKRKKTTSLLLFLLSVSDFTTLITAIPSIYHFFKAARDEVVPANWFNMSFTVIQLFFFRLSLFITTMMSVQRLVAITFPRYVIKPRMVYITLSIWFILIAISFFMYMLKIKAFPPIKDAPKYNLTTTRDCYCVWDPMVQTVTCPLGWDEVVNTFIINLLAPAFINIITSAITITKLLKRNAKVHGRKSVITIVLLSISAGFMYVPAPFVGFLMGEFEQFNTEVADGGNVMMNRKAVYEIPMFLVVAFLPQITSALNPIILIVRGSTLQEYARHS